MTITGISEIKTDIFKDLKPVKEKMDIYINGIPSNVSNRNGMISVYTGSGGSGKSSLLLNMFRDTKLYKKKFDNIFLFTPSASFLSVEKHPFLKHDKIYHELTISHLMDIEKKLIDIKESGDLEYSLVIIDDFASTLKSKDIEKILNKLLIKARHLCCGFIFTLQTFLYMPRQLRKQITFITIFKPKTKTEWDTITDELLQMEKMDGLKIFNYVFNEPYSHLDIDLVENKLYKNGNLLNIIDTNSL